jgi:transcriptional regulator with XRE-family HTH domain
MSLGEHYGKLRQERGFSLRQAARNDLTASALSRFENGKTELSASQFVRAMANLQLNWNERAFYN